MNNDVQFIRKIAQVRGHSIQSDELETDTYNRLTGLGPGHTRWDHLRHLADNLEDATPPPPPVLPDPPVALPATDITSAGFTAHWEYYPGATKYFVDVSTNTDFSDGASVSVPDPSTVSLVVHGLGILIAGTTVYYRIRARVASGIFSQSSNIITVALSGGACDPPPAPVITFVSGGGTTVSFDITQPVRDPLLGWVILASTDGPDEGFTSIDFFDHPDVTVDLSGIIGLGEPAWIKVTAKDAEGCESPASNVLAWNGIPAAPYGLYAEDIQPTTASVGWQGQTEDYFFDLATDYDFLSPVLSYTNVSVSGRSIGLSGLTPNTTYFARVRAVNVHGTSANSLPTQFTTLPNNRWLFTGDGVHSFRLTFSSSTGFVAVETNLGVTVPHSTAEEVVISPAGGTKIRAWSCVSLVDSTPLGTITTIVSNGGNLVEVDSALLPEVENLSLDNNPDLTVLDFRGNPALETFSASHCGLTSLLVSGLSNLLWITADRNQITSLSLDGCSALTRLNVGYNRLTTLSVAGKPNLEFALAYQNPTMLSATVAENSSLVTVDFSSCALTRAQVDGILHSLVADGLHNGDVNLSGGNNQGPSFTGATDAGILRSRGWSVIHN